MLVVPGVGVVMSSLPGVRGMFAMRLMIVLMMAVVMHVDTTQATSATSGLVRMDTVCSDLDLKSWSNGRPLLGAYCHERRHRSALF
jgi:hypothetical protein